MSHHAYRMMASGTIVGMWLVAHVVKPVLFGRETFHGSERQYSSYYAPVLALHTLLAPVSIAAGGDNLYRGLRRLRYGTLGAMAAGTMAHRRLGYLVLWTFGGTMMTAYLLYRMLFVRFTG